MSFTLLTELSSLHEDRCVDRTIALLENVETLISQSLVAKLSGDDPFGAGGGLNIDDVAAQIAGLIVLGKKDFRGAFDDFASVDAEGFSENLLKFLDELGEANAGKEFDEKTKNADMFLLDVGKSYAKSLTAKWKETLEHAYIKKDDTSEQSKNTIVTDLKKIEEYWKKIYNMLKTHKNAKQATAPTETGNATQANPNDKTPNMAPVPTPA